MATTDIVRSTFSLFSTMAGLGRRSHYRKHLTDAVLHDLPEPEEGECVAKVVATRGGNQFDVLVANNDEPQLAILPTKFNKLIWVKRGDFCIVRTGEDANDDEETEERDSFSGIRYLVTHILYKDQIKHLKSKNLWPDDKEFNSLEENRKDKEEQEHASANEEEHEHEEEEDVQHADDDGIVYDTGYGDELLFVNTNRLATLQIEDSESESSDED